MATSNSTQPKTNWPVMAYIGALLFAFITLFLFTHSLGGAALNIGRSFAQLAICGVLGLRLARAMHRNEHNKIWIAYIVAMIFAVPLWCMAESLVLSLGH
jgi:predicted permease